MAKTNKKPKQSTTYLQKDSEKVTTTKGLGLIRAGEASPIATLDYVADKLDICEHKLFELRKLRRSAADEKTLAKVSPTRVLDGISGEPLDGYSIIYSSSNKFQPVNAFTLLDELNMRPSYVSAWTKMVETSPSGVLVGVVLPETVGGVRLRREDRVQPMVLAPLSLFCGDVWGIQTVLPEWYHFTSKRVYDVEDDNSCFADGTRIGITINDLLYDLIRWNRWPHKHKEDRMEAKRHKIISEAVDNALRDTVIFPLVSIDTISSTISKLYRTHPY